MKDGCKSVSFAAVFLRMSVGGSGNSHYSRLWGAVAHPFTGPGLVGPGWFQGSRTQALCRSPGGMGEARIHARLVRQIKIAVTGCYSRRLCTILCNSEVWRASSDTACAECSMALAVSSALLLMLLRELAISALVVDCCSAAVAMPRT